MSDYVIRRVSRICEDVGNVEELHLRNGIEYLNLHGNKLLNTLGFTNLSSLTELDMSTNSISSVSNLESLVCLRSLNLSNNILSEIHPSSFNSLVSLKQLNLSYNVLRNIAFLSAFSHSQSKLSEFLFHGNEISNINSTIKHLSCCISIKRISIADNPITDQALSIFNRVPNIEGIDGVNRRGNPLPPIQIYELPNFQNSQNSLTSSSKVEHKVQPAGNPWESGCFEQNENFSEIASKLMEMANTNRQNDQSQENRETREKIDKIEKQLEQLIQLKKDAPKLKKPSVPITQATHSKFRPPCSNCNNVMNEMKMMSKTFEKSKNDSEDIAMTLRQEKFSVEKILEDKNIDFCQKENQLKSALEACTKFKDSYLREKSKADSYESTMARAAKELTTERKKSKLAEENIQVSRHQNENLATENEKLNGKSEKNHKELQNSRNRCEKMEEEILTLNQKLRNSIHPDSPEMQKLISDKLSVAGKYMEEWKLESKRKYENLESEFREALCIEDKEKKALRVEIDKVKEANSELRINQEKLYFSERKAQDTLSLMTKQANELKKYNEIDQEKISKLVDAIRKSKELSDSRYRDEQRAKQQLNDIQKDKSKLISALTSQEGILNGLKAEREQWGSNLASQSSSLAKERGTLTAEIEALKSKLEIEFENKNKLKIKEKELYSAQQSYNDCKNKIDSLRAENSDLRSQLTSSDKFMSKMESKISKLETERENLMEDMTHFDAEKNKMEKKWRDRTELIESLEKKVLSISHANYNKETYLNDVIADQNKQLSEMQAELDEKNQIISVKDQDLNKVKMFAIQNKELINVIKFEKEKVHQVEEELRQLLMERQADKEAMKQKLENFTKHLLNK